MKTEEIYLISFKQVYDTKPHMLESEVYAKMCGDNMRQIRKKIISYITGKSLPVAKCGVRKVYETLLARFQSSGI